MCVAGRVSCLEEFLEEGFDGFLLLVYLVLGVEDLGHVMRPVALEVRRGGEPASVDHEVRTGDVRRLVAGENNALYAISDAVPARRSTTVLFMV
jgi:hypothetical protein